MLILVKISGVDVTSKLIPTTEYERAYGDILSEITLKFVRTVNSLITLNTGLTLEVWRGWSSALEENVFSGYIEKFTPEGGTIDVLGIDKMWDLVRKEVTHIYDTTTGINTSVSASKLIDSNARFMTKGIGVGNYVANTTDATNATVVSVDSETQITLSADIFGGTGKAYTISIDSTSGKVSAIFKDLVITYGGLNCDDTTVQDSGSDIIIQKFVCNHADPFERCKALANALDWQFYFRADTDKVYFEPKGYVSNSTVLTVGSNVMNVPKWQNDITEMCNDVTIIGAKQIVETTKSGQIGVTSGFNTTGIVLDYEPVSVKVYGDASNPPTTLKKGGTPGAFETYDYYVDKSNRMILPKDGTTFTASDYYEIRYSLAAPTPVNLYDQGSINTYGRFTKTITYADIRSVEDSESRATKYITRYSTPFKYTTLKVKNNSSYGLAPGQTIRVVDSMSVPTVDDYFVINKIRIRWPTDYDEIDVGDKYWRLADFQSNILEKIKRLEEAELANSDIVANLVSIDNTSGTPINIKNRYAKISTQTVSGTNCFIWGNPSYGLWGTAKWGSTDVGAETAYRIMQGANDYVETFYDTDFKDAATTATWNTTTKQLTFTASQVGQSTSIDYNNGTITTATMTVTKSSGTYNYYMSADGGSHWESCTSGAAHAFSNTGADLRWKIVESASGTGTITQVEITAYH